jgi:hypothetical protein
MTIRLQSGSIVLEKQNVGFVMFKETFAAVEGMGVADKLPTLIENSTKVGGLSPRDLQDIERLRQACERTNGDLNKMKEILESTAQ